MRTMLSEKGLLNNELEFTVEGTTHYMPVEVVVEFVENAPTEIIKKVNNNLSKIDFMNGNVLHFVEHLAKGII